MSTSLNHTPLVVKPRRMAFPFSEVTQRRFYDGNLLKSAYIAALSATFPAGEAEFIESVRMFRDQISDPELKEQIRGFIGQEAHHSKEHRRFNEVLVNLGFDVLRLEKVFEKDLASSIKNRSPAERLAYTVCFEHQTAILAHEFLTNPAVLEGMDATIRELLLWHAVEEIEHKSVAFDLYMACVGDRALLRRAQKDATLTFTRRVSKYMCLLLWWSRSLPGWRDVKGYLRYMFGPDGLMTNLKQPYRDFFRDDFHPWDHDNQALIEDWKQRHYDSRHDLANTEKSV